MSHHTRSSWMRHLVVTGLLVAALLALANCGRTSAINPAATTIPPTLTATTIPPTPAPTVTPAPARPLRWQARTTPASFSASGSGLSLAVSPVDGALVWACAPQGSAVHIWVSHDQAATWQRLGDLQGAGALDHCSIIMDDLDPATAVVWVASAMYITRDGGHTWQPLYGPDSVLRQISTYHESVYAIFTPQFADAMPYKSQFVVSSDGLRTWRQMDSKLVSPGSNPIVSGYVRHFWVNPATGAMLVRTATSVVWTDHFIASTDGGTTWQDLHAPQADDFVVRTPFAAGPWEICGVRRSNSSDHPSWNNTMPCTFDGGATWQTRTITPIPDGFAIADDGSVLGSTGSALMRLTPSGRDWQSLGPLKEFWVPPNAYVAGSGRGSVWDVPAWGGPYNGSMIHVASYP